MSYLQAIERDFQNYTLKAMVEGSGSENSSCAIVEVMPDFDIVVTGYRKAVSQDLPGA